MASNVSASLWSILLLSFKLQLFFIKIGTGTIELIAFFLRY